MIKPIRTFFSQIGFEPRINNPILMKPKNNNVFVKLFFGISRLLGRVPFEIFGKSFVPVIGSRIVEMPFVFENLPKKKLKILDFGCNESALPIQMASLGNDVVGYDLQDYEYKHRNFKFYKGNFMDNKFADESFDAVTSVSVIEHCGLGSYDSPVFSDGDKKIVDELKRVLKKDGVFILTVPFGKRYKDDFQRIYDSKALSYLVSGFKVETEKFFIRNKERDEWFESSKSKAELILYNEKRESDAVACLVCRR